MQDEEPRGALSDQEKACVAAVHRVWNQTGPGLTECEYRDCVLRELRTAGHRAASEVPCLVTYEGHPVGAGRRLDLVVDDEFVVEFKSQTALVPDHLAQLVVYLRQRAARSGLLVNFPRLSGKVGLATLVAARPERLKRLCCNIGPEVVHVRLPTTSAESGNRLVAVSCDASRWHILRV